jgi:hypothetical protein
VCCVVPDSRRRADDLPLLGLADVELRVSNFKQSRKFYHDLLGFEKPFDSGGAEATGAVVEFFKINDRQFIELVVDRKVEPDSSLTQMERASSSCSRAPAPRSEHDVLDQFSDHARP